MPGKPIYLFNFVCQKTQRVPLLAGEGSALPVDISTLALSRGKENAWVQGRAS